MRPDFETQLHDLLEKTARQIPQDMTVIPELRRRLATAAQHSQSRRYPFQRQQRLFVPIGAVLLVIVLAFVTVHSFQPDKHDKSLTPTPSMTPAVPTPTVTPAPPVRTIGEVNGIPTYGTLSDVQMVSSREGWAVGQITDATVSWRTLLLHYIDGQWNTVDVHLPTAELMGIDMTSPDDGWAVGAIREPAEHVLLLHYQNHQWNRVANPIAGNLHTVKFLSPDEGWATGFEYGVGRGALIMHFQAGVWSQVSVPSYGKPLMPLTQSYGIATIEPDDAWFGGATPAPLLHYHHGQWDVATITLSASETSNGGTVGIESIAISVPDDGWAAGYDPDGPLLLHYDGKNWNPVTQSSSWSETSPSSFLGIAMTSPQEGWAVGETAPRNPNDCCADLLYHYQGGQWTEYSTPFAFDLFGISMISPNEGWAVGQGLGALKNPSNPDDSSISILLHYSNGVWTQYHG